MSPSLFDAVGVNMTNAEEREKWVIRTFGYSAETLMKVYSAAAVLGLLGIVGNVLNVVVWTRPQLKSSTSILLTALAVCDIVNVICIHGTSWISTLALYYYDSPALIYVKHFIIPYVVVCLFPIYRTAHTTSIFLTLTITVERYTAVCRPFRKLVFCTYSRSCKYAVAVVTGSILYNLIEFLRQEVVPVVDSNGQITSYHLNYTELGQSPLFQTIYTIHRSWLYFILIFSLPLICIVVLSTRIYLELRRTKKLRKKLTDSQMKENKLTMMLVYVVVEFLACSSVMILYTTVYMLQHWKDKVKFNKASLYPFFNFVDTFNSSSNFVTYVLFGSAFRETLVKTFSCRKGNSQQRHPISLTRQELAMTQSNSQGSRVNKRVAP